MGRRIRGALLMSRAVSGRSRPGPRVRYAVNSQQADACESTRERAQVRALR